jgi:hypothetical protein
MRYYLRPRCIGIIFAHQVAHFLFHFTLQYLHAGFTQITLGGHFGIIFCTAPADRRYTLKLFSHEQLHMVDFHLRVYRISDPEKRQKGEKRPQKIVIFGEMGQKRPKISETPPVK